jgi:hypothetical protein
MKRADEVRFMAVQPRRMIGVDWNAPRSLPEVRAERTFAIVRFAAVDGRPTRVSSYRVGWGDGGEWDKACNYFDKAWGFVPGNLQKRFAAGPLDWSEWMKQLAASHQADRKQ